jgi:glyoxylase-like metal-dependent hydrolase (beta-lactamase superfamily II)
MEDRMMNFGSRLQHSISLNRRQLLAGAAGLAATAAFPRRLWAADAPHTFTQGDFEITVISDGHLVLPSSVLAPDAPAEERAALMAELGIGEEVMPATNAPLIRAGSDLILIDNGSGTEFQPSAGKLIENLQAAGIDPASITKMVFTHAHPDHMWATLGASGLNFPNAAVYVSGAEWDFWMNPDLMSQMPEEMHPFILGAQKHLAAVEGMVTRVAGGDDIVTGVTVLDTPGHTPGHISLEVAGDDGLIITGDAIAVAAVYFPHPDWTFGFDADPALAVTNRTAMLDRAATDKIKMLGFHWQYPGIGYAERSGDAYAYVPAT